VCVAVQGGFVYFEFTFYDAYVVPLEEGFFDFIALGVVANGAATLVAGEVNFILGFGPGLRARSRGGEGGLFRSGDWSGFSSWTDPFVVRALRRDWGGFRERFAPGAFVYYGFGGFDGEFGFVEEGGSGGHELFGVGLLAGRGGRRGINVLWFRTGANVKQFYGDSAGRQMWFDVCGLRRSGSTLGGSSLILKVGGVSRVFIVCG
jgi:hypothetical protein